MTAYDTADRTHQAIRLTRLKEHLLQYPSTQVTTGYVNRRYTAWGISRKRSTAKRDLQTLANCGFLTAHGPVEQRHYRLNTRQKAAA